MINSNIKRNSNVFQKYEIINSIGNGGMGSVFLVKSLENNQYYALKYRNNDFNEVNKKRFKSEIQLLGKLNCKRIPKLIDFYEDDTEQYYVMEYIKGVTLQSKIADNGALDSRLAVNYGLQIAEAIGDLHANGIIHRDIKSQNILIDESQNIKLIDLGISLTNDSQRFTKTNAIICSPYYAAPEFTIRNSKITKAVDIYALGIIMFEMIIGKYPFEGNQESETILMHRNKNFPNPREFRDINQALCNVILKATAKRPEDRYQDVWDFSSDLRTSLDITRTLEKPLSPKTIKPKKGIAEFINSNLFLVLAISVILLVILVLVFLIWRLA
ncbi:serine/threonine-protein kinase [Mycoplasmopsis gallopavonis]|uniref:Serine/threonine protein kinase n=1 Tax=Mycoplasmopsis gallopavonis TaxID=76629 RepID=A0A449B0A7_9BACT|nr:serine/threonine-protein kinase [Mycoplasmopsis gallopavonis]RIV16462.1 serine/threonine protein kinase [Mycoplasmopsis gallopavonis]VEU73195.1 serine/threonine protein kinase [Mycoplasmopsis gallopavonis]